MSWRHPDEPSETTGNKYKLQNGNLVRDEFREWNGGGGSNTSRPAMAAAGPSGAGKGARAEVGAVPAHQLVQVPRS